MNDSAQTIISYSRVSKTNRNHREEVVMAQDLIVRAKLLARGRHPVVYSSTDYRLSRGHFLQGASRLPVPGPLRSLGVVHQG